MPTSLESSRPIMAPSTRASVRSSVRYSLYSEAPTYHSNATTDSADEQIKDIQERIDRLKPMEDQCYTLNENQQTTFQQLAFVAKVERALDRRMSSQDAVMRPKKRKTTSAADRQRYQEKTINEKEGTVAA